MENQPTGTTGQISIQEIIQIYVAIGSIETPPTGKRTEILDRLETVILHFTSGFFIPQQGAH